MSGVPLLEVRGISKSFAGNRSLAAWARGASARGLQAVRDVSFALQAGETLGIVGESGCGKSTLGRCIVGLYEPTAGTVLYKGSALHGAGADRRATSRRVQMIFQDPYASLNPRLSVEQVLGEVLRVHGLARGSGERRDRVDELLSMVGLSPQLGRQLPHAFSGGQRQRISIARALAAEPEIIVADEPVSALDVSIQAQIVNLFIELRERLGLDATSSLRTISASCAISATASPSCISGRSSSSPRPGRCSASRRTPTRVRCSPQFPGPTRTTARRP